VWTSWDSSFSGKELSDDIRLLSLALTASHAPSSTLDSQYPVDSAIRLHKAIFGGIKNCVPEGTVVFYAPPGPLASLPLGVLLTSAPPPHDNGLDLSKADWLALKYRLSTVTSAAHFIAARQRSLTAGSGNSFIGIGDPQLQQSSIAPSSTDLLLSQAGP